MFGKRFIVLILLLISSPALFSQETINLESKVISANVYTQTATVTREAKINLPSAGEYMFVFSNLTSAFSDQSVQVAGKGAAKAKIVDVNTGLKYSTETSNTLLKNIQAKTDSLKLADQVSSDNINLLESQKNYMESLKAEYAKEINDKLAQGKANIQEWQNRYAFFNKNLTSIYEGIREESIKRKRIADEIKTIEENIRDIKIQDEKSYKEIYVKILAEQSGELILQASYTVYDASWKPVYDSRLYSENKNLDLSYFGMVKQSTGEDWKNINLTLSTAKPLTNEAEPELDPLYLNISGRTVTGKNENTTENTGYTSNPRYRFDTNLKPGCGAIEGKAFDRKTGELLIGGSIVIQGTSLGAASDYNGFYHINNVSDGKYTVKCSYIGYKSLTAIVDVREKEILNIDFFLDTEVMVGQAIEITAQAEGQLSAIKQDLIKKNIPEEKIEFSDVNLNSKETFSTFELKSKCDIPSDNSPHKIHITTQPMDISAEYKSIPKKSLNTFLVCRVVNKKDFTLTEGEMNLFMDDEYVNRCHIKNTAPGDTFNIDTGIDGGIKTERKLINKFTESSGFLNGKTSITYDYEITAVNNKSKEQKITVLDQLPISQNEDIKVEALTPKEDELNIDKEKIITWKLQLKPGEKLVIPFKYRVTFPANQYISGPE
jgi:hypothetical protein